jgi:hypothetical protein
MQIKPEPPPNSSEKPLRCVESPRGRAQELRSTINKFGKKISNTMYGIGAHPRIFHENANYHFSKFSEDGIAGNLLRYRITKQMPSRSVLCRAMSSEDPVDRIRAWEGCREGWGLAAINALCQAAAHRVPENVVHIQAVQFAIETLIGPQPDVHSARRMLRRMLAQIHPDATRRFLKQEPDTWRAAQGRDRLMQAILGARQVLNIPAYERVICSPLVRAYGNFSWVSFGIPLMAATALTGCAIAASPILAKIAIGIVVGFVTNELRLFCQEHWAGRTVRRSGVRAFFATTRVTTPAMT